MSRNTASAFLAILAAAAAVAALPPSARAEAGSVVGGGGATITGGGDNMVIAYSTGGAGGGGGPSVQPGRLARVHAGEVEYLDQAAAGAGLGREAWLVGGGENAEVAYASPVRRR